MSVLSDYYHNASGDPLLRRALAALVHWNTRDHEAPPEVVNLVRQSSIESPDGASAWEERYQQTRGVPADWDEVEYRSDREADPLCRWAFAKLWLQDHVETDEDEESRPRMSRYEEGLRPAALAILLGRANPLMRMLLAEQQSRGIMEARRGEREGEILVGPTKHLGGFTEEYRTTQPDLAHAYSDARSAGLSPDKARERVDRMAQGLSVPPLGINPLSPGTDMALVREAMEAAPRLEQMLRETGLSEAQRISARAAAAEGNLTARLVLFLFDEGVVPRAGGIEASLPREEAFTRLERAESPGSPTEPLDPQDVFASGKMEEAAARADNLLALGWAELLRSGTSRRYLSPLQSHPLSPAAARRWDVAYDRYLGALAETIPHTGGRAGLLIALAPRALARAESSASALETFVMARLSSTLSSARRAEAHALANRTQSEAWRYFNRDAGDQFRRRFTEAAAQGRSEEAVRLMERWRAADAAPPTVDERGTALDLSAAAAAAAAEEYRRVFRSLAAAGRRSEALDQFARWREAAGHGDRGVRQPKPDDHQLAVRLEQELELQKHEAQARELLARFHHAQEMNNVDDALALAAELTQPLNTAEPAAARAAASAPGPRAGEEAPARLTQTQERQVQEAVRWLASAALNPARVTGPYGIPESVREAAHLLPPDAFPTAIAALRANPGPDHQMAARALSNIAPRPPTFQVVATSSDPGAQALSAQIGRIGTERAAPPAASPPASAAAPSGPSLSEALPEETRAQFLAQRAYLERQRAAGRFGLLDIDDVTVPVSQPAVDPTQPSRFNLLEFDDDPPRASTPAPALPPPPPVQDPRLQARARAEALLLDCQGGANVSACESLARSYSHVLSEEERARVASYRAAHAARPEPGRGAFLEIDDDAPAAPAPAAREPGRGAYLEIDGAEPRSGGDHRLPAHLQARPMNEVVQAEHEAVVRAARAYRTEEPEEESAEEESTEEEHEDAGPAAPASTPCGPADYYESDTGMGETTFCRVHDDEVGRGGVCLTRGTLVHLRIRHGDGSSSTTTLAGFARDNAMEDDEEIVAQVAALGPGQSVQLGGGAAASFTVTRIDAPRELGRDASAAAENVRGAPSVQAWEDLREYVLYNAGVQGLDPDYAAAYLRRHQRRILPRLGLAQVTAAAADLVVLAAATARQRLPLEPGIHPRAVVASALAALGSWLENRPRIDIEGADLRAQVGAARAALEDAAAGRPEAAPTFRCFMPGCNQYLSVAEGLCESAGGSKGIMCRQHRRASQASRVGYSVLEESAPAELPRPAVSAAPALAAAPARVAPPAAPPGMIDLTAQMTQGIATLEELRTRADAPAAVRAESAELLDALYHPDRAGAAQLPPLGTRLRLAQDYLVGDDDGGMQATVAAGSTGTLIKIERYSRESYERGGLAGLLWIKLDTAHPRISLINSTIAVPLWRRPPSGARSPGLGHQPYDPSIFVEEAIPPEQLLAAAQKAVEDVRRLGPIYPDEATRFIATWVTTRQANVQRRLLDAEADLQRTEGALTRVRIRGTPEEVATAERRVRQADGSLTALRRDRYAHDDLVAAQGEVIRQRLLDEHLIGGERPGAAPAAPVAADATGERTRRLPSLKADEAVARIKAGLRRRSGRAYKVSGGSRRSTAWGWIEIKPPGKKFGDGKRLTPAEAQDLARLLGLQVNEVFDGVTIPPDPEFYWEYVDRAEGSPPRVRGTRKYGD